jgi:hypothetical protein
MLEFGVVLYLGRKKGSVEFHVADLDGRAANRCFVCTLAWNSVGTEFIAERFLHYLATSQKRDARNLRLEIARA